MHDLAHPATQTLPRENRRATDDPHGRRLPGHDCSPQKQEGEAVNDFLIYLLVHACVGIVAALWIATWFSDEDL